MRWMIDEMADTAPGMTTNEELEIAETTPHNTTLTLYSSMILLVMR